MGILACILIPLLLVVVAVWVVRSKHYVVVLSARDLAAAADRAVQGYRRRFVPLLALAAVLIPLGIASPLLTPLAL